MRSRDNLAAVTVSADLCLRRGERLYTPDTGRLFKEIHAKLSE